MFWMDPRKVSLALVAFLPSSAVFGQIVQLPTMGTFSISGGALVPDSGAAYLGGSGRAIGGGSRLPGPRLMADLAAPEEHRSTRPSSTSMN